METMNFAQRKMANMVVEQRVDEVIYEFTEIKLPSGDNIALGIEKSDDPLPIITMRDLYALKDLQCYIENGTYKTVSLAGGATITIAESEMKNNHLMIAIAKPASNGCAGHLRPLSNEDIMFLFNNLSA